MKSRFFNSTKVLGSITLLFVLLLFGCNIKEAKIKSAVDSVQQGETVELKALNVADGNFQVVNINGKPYYQVLDFKGFPASYMYFDVPDAFRSKESPVYLQVFFMDYGWGTFSVEYDSATTARNQIQQIYHNAEKQYSNSLFNKKQEKEAVFLLEKPMFAGRQNDGADLRLNAEIYNGQLTICKAQLCSSPSPLYNKLSAEQKRIDLIHDFQAVKLKPKGEDGFVIKPPVFPEIVWEQPYLVEKLWGEMSLKVRWFDGQLNEVNSPKTEGRYAAYIEATMPDGKKIRRAMTFYCTKSDWSWWRNQPFLEVPYIKDKMIDKAVWQQYNEYIGSFAGDKFIRMLSEKEDGAIFLAGLYESKLLQRKPTQLDWPCTMNQDYQLALKRKLLNVEDKYPKLKLPRKKRGDSAPVLRVGTEDEAGIKSGTADKIHEICQQWYDATKIPFTILVARRGIIFIHEAIGSADGHPVDVNTNFRLASSTKAITGLMFAQFIDQGLIAPDDPVGKFLPDFPAEGNKVLTLRHCLTHTSGLEGHDLWGGVYNPWVDNIISNGYEGLRPGEVMIYNGMGFALAGKVMEIVSGKSIFRLMHENFFGPLGMKEPTIKALSYGLNCSVGDLAMVGQLMLNRGSYGDKEFFSPETFEKLMPHPLTEFYPDIRDRNWDYGLGIYWMRHANSPSGTKGVPKSETVFSKNTIGHGGANGEILRVDLDNELVVTMARPELGNDYFKFLPRFLRAIESGLE